LDPHSSGLDIGGVAAGMDHYLLRQVALSLAEQLGESWYWVIAVSVLLLALGTASFFWYRGGRDGTRARYLAPVSAIFSALILIAFRWPTLMHLNLNVDEDFLVAGSLALKERWNYFAVLDGTTSGPLNFAPLVVFSLLGSSLDIAAARVVALVLIWLCILCAYAIIRAVASPRFAFFCTVVLSLLFGSFTHDGWTHYSSAHVSVLLVLLGFLHIVSIIVTQRITTLSAVSFGVTVFAMPFAKLQSSLFAALFAGWFFILIAFRVKTPATLRSKVFIGLAALFSLLLPLLVLTGARAVYINAEDFWISYVEYANYYVSAGAHTMRERFGVGWRMLHSNPELLLLFLVVAIAYGLAGCALLALRAPVSQTSRSLLVLVASVLVIGLVTVLAPGRDFTHYLLFLFVPACVGLTLVASILYEAWAARRKGRQPMWPIPILCVNVCCVLLIPRIVGGHQSFARIPEVPKVHQSFISKVMDAAKLPEDRLAIWGWCPQLHGQTWMAPGTRDVITQRHIIPSPLREYYRARYVKDLRERRPAFFVDSTGTNACALDFNNRARFGHETVPELKREIDSEYQFLCDQEQLRLYVSYDRLMSHIPAEYLYGLVVYLDLTATGSLEYSRFQKMFHRYIEMERMRTKLQKMNAVEVQTTVRTITDRVLDDMVNGKLVEPSLAETLKARALRISELVQKRHSSEKSQAIVKLADPIRIYRRIFRH
jgi:hypothetical protein